MNVKNQLLTCLLSLFIFPTIFISCDDDDESPGLTSDCPNAPALYFEESNGLVIIEAEDVPNRSNIGEWEFQSGSINNVSGHSGEGFIVFKGEDSFRDAGNSIITYNVKINTPGIYRFLYASTIGTGDNNTEHNDAFVNFPDADAFYGYRSNSNTIAIPNDEGIDSSNPDRNDPILAETYPGATYKVPNGSNPRNIGYLKVYMNQLDEWWYEGSTSDSDAHAVYARFDSPGTYTILISGRSSSFAIDRLVLVIEEGDFTDLGSRNKRKEALSPIESVDSTCQ
ncbi:hypothetical protein [Fulvivirga lutea]|uniref:Uncharacterized protein n=1 Tax=Fulvivirga lutea TaxID=2810512 RepID=A0A974WE50_9BACT|nr:hypothetical protein [Fulvivirga lutea]QSE96075.1 hypothetical protein JR347_10650 [Fulvivirga lutea]